jgi:hypothetical protein
MQSAAAAGSSGLSCQDVEELAFKILLPLSFSPSREKMKESNHFFRVLTTNNVPGARG